MKRATQQSGFTIVSAIFILVVLAALGAFILVVSTTQQIGSAYDVQGARAYQAARAGIEWGIYQTWSSSPAGRAGAAACTSTTLAFAGTTLHEFRVTVSCVATPDPAGMGGPTVFTVIAVACNRPNLDGSCSDANGNANSASAGSFGYIERRVTVTI
ncbi:pilus assembly PilX N-terminal domain-containing protein [Denitratisoma oestradiolicum]|uniref:Agglutinin biogenesis protein MshP n=1 Tax=Denitratisoma oestradiolicum TaxID=311182 RepID=A0A6S6XXN0_9PROT|nr:pilus assembly PilX N-terminal domain-containing protein [Denitratisoma oestradiolicum]TWO80532.1 hypothetical protein CBW56_08820 [Denitratisoma oestradiolicum]CAB1367602.1 conserved protein of unknown function [Denitratisoma oestradiolicum]